MCCHYYLEKNLVVEYLSQNGRIEKLIINKEQKKKSYDELMVCNIGLESYKANLTFENSNKKKIFFGNNTWSSETLRKKYSKKLTKQFPEINKFLNVYEVVNMIDY